MTAKVTATPPTARDFDLIEVALQSAAEACQSGASLMHRGRGRAKLDPLAAEYLHALDAVEAWRRAEGL